MRTRSLLPTRRKPIRPIFDISHINQGCNRLLVGSTGGDFCILSERNGHANGHARHPVEAISGDGSRKQKGQARGLLDEYESVVEAKLRGGRQELLLHRAKGVIAFAEGRAEEAIAEFRRSDKGECPNCALADLGRAYDLMGQADSVIAIYERYISTPSLSRAAWDADKPGLHLRTPRRPVRVECCLLLVQVTNPVL